jgi:hypothetical protein
MGGNNMSMILGMDIWVFTAWIGTILSSLLCLLYGIYYEFLKKTDKKRLCKNNKKKSKYPEDK